ncbi:hypothetical protein CW745_16335 [Psychromonas sp. psych-6C06]|uniref:hypothetical protein n=1 Tax=Psychromonas sp. psych-6C06 TaxID=2058089 RepID=UPI000C33410B|nr:hypothetical protein [Psychromonas sp. psych-6C06]PKF60196.1 hypothetical protein CW745_16335 [Psychromonas sp. psych-6C06]
MFKTLAYSLFLLLFSFHCSASEIAEIEPESNRSHQIIPMILGAGLITWGAYELGDSAQDGQRNVYALWGTALVASAGIVIYQSVNDEGLQLTLVPSINKDVTLAVNYKF